MSRGKKGLTRVQRVPNFCSGAPRMSTVGSIPIAGEVWQLRLDDGPIQAGGKEHASYVDHPRHLIRVNGRLAAQERLWAACCAVAVASIPAQTQLAACPLVGLVD
jgi:hypothetical protein